MGYTINLMGYGLTSFWGEPGDGDGELKSTWDVQMGIELVLGKTCRYHGSESQLFFFAHYFLNWIPAEDMGIVGSDASVLWTNKKTPCVHMLGWCNNAWFSSCEKNQLWLQMIQDDPWWSGWIWSRPSQVWHVLCLRYDHLQWGKAFRSPRIGSEDARLFGLNIPFENTWHHHYWPSHLSLG